MWRAANSKTKRKGKTARVDTQHTAGCVGAFLGPLAFFAAFLAGDVSGVAAAGASAEDMDGVLMNTRTMTSLTM